MSEPRYVVGIDLGTTHCAVAAARLDEPESQPRALALPHLVSANAVEARPLLPSFLYLAAEGEPALALPWDAERRHAVGEYARRRAAEAPGRVVFSAKSWLSHAGVDRRAGVLPQGAPSDVELVSPVEATYRYLDHLVEAWDAEVAHGDPELALTAQEVIITVPASFDAAARELTVEAAYAAGIERLTLLEEPQAAVYAWVAGMGDDWRRHLAVGEILLVVDIGGGTTDFSAIAVEDDDGALALRRVAVGDHILLGGDNMDLALAHAVSQRLAAEGTTLDRFQLVGLTHVARAAKERLLSDNAPASAPVALASRGSQLFAATVRTELERATVERVVLDGFFPLCDADARPQQRARGGLTRVALPYASDAAVTRHLAAFLARQAGAAGDGSALEPLRPSAVLFNGGVLRSPAIRARLLEALSGFGGAAPRALPGDDPDLAVALGAAYFGLVRQRGGVRIRGGSARAYYVGVEGPMPAVPGLEPPLVALCVAPFGMEEGEAVELGEHRLALVVGEPVRFRFFGSSSRRQDVAGEELEDWGAEVEELSPVELTLPADERRPGDIVPVHLRASVTPVGTLLLEAVPEAPLRPGERWRIELGLRDEG